MATYYFELKDDKKPDGTKKNTVAHLEYINREGAYKDADEQEFVKKIIGTNFITSRKIADAYNGKYALMYQTDNFGAIANTPKGIAVTENPTETTLAIALMIANETMEQQPLVIRGSKNFREKILTAAARSNLDVTFDSREMQAEFQRKKEQFERGRRRFIERGGRYARSGEFAQSRPQPTSRRKVGDVTQSGLRLPTLSERNMARPESERTDVLLQGDESHKLDKHGAGLYPNVRRDLGREQRELAEKSAKIILDRIAKNSEQVFAASHAQYINRESYFAKRGGVVFTGHRLPKWANGSAKEFFAAADRHESKKNYRYREIIFSLPNELTTEKQYRQVIDAFLKKNLSNHYYAYAVHEKTGLMSDEERHPHIHIMFSERIVDDIENGNERTAGNFFSRSAPQKKDMPIPSFEERRNHGAPKDVRWKNKYHLIKIRKDYADITNAVLKKNGFSVRIDPRTLKEQRAEALRNGDEFTAKILDRNAEQRLGVITPENYKNPLVERTKQARKAQQKFQSAAYAADKTKREIEELEAKDEAQKNLLAAKNLLDAKELAQQVRQSPLVKELCQTLTEAINEVNLCKQRLVTAEEAEEKATLEYLTADEKKLWHDYKKITNEKANLEKFCQTLEKPQDYNDNDLRAYKKIIADTQTKITELSKEIFDAAPQFTTIQKKVAAPGCRKNIERAAHNILQANAADRQKFAEANRQLATAVDELRQAVFNEEMNLDQQEFLSAREVYDILRHRYTTLKDEQKNLNREYKTLEKQVISTNRALAMAENIFSKGAWKKYRGAERKYKKQSELIVKKRRVAALTGKLWQEEPTLRAKEAELAAMRRSLDVEYARLKKMCQTPAAQVKIQTIATGILRKNAKIAERYKEVDKQRKICREQIAQVKEKMTAVYGRMSDERATTKYRVKEPLASGTPTQKFIPAQKFTSYERASIIANAIGGEPRAVQLVATSDGSALEVKKDWNLMTELDKDEERMKALQQLI